MKTIGIIGALPQEIKRLTVGVQEKKTQRYDGVEYHIGKRSGKKLIICSAGMGKANAAATAQVLITRYDVDALVVSGIAGNMNDAIGIGDVVIGKELCYHDADDELLAMSPPGTALYTAHPRLVDAAIQGCRLTAVPFIVGKIATGDTFISDSETKRRIKKAHQPDCVEMEGAAVAQVAMRCDIPFVVLRTMSDNADESFEALGGKTVQELDIAQYADTAAAITNALVDSL